MAVVDYDIRRYTAADHKSMSVQSEDEAAYLDAHNAASGADLSTSWNVYNNYSAGNYAIGRAYLYFDTASRPSGGIITALQLLFYADNKSEDDATHSTLHVIKPVHGDDVVLNDFGDLVAEIVSLGSIAYADITAFAVNTITLTSSAYQYVLSGDYSKLCLRIYGDLNALPPTGINNVLLPVANYASWKLRVTTTVIAPLVSTEAATNVADTTATLNGDITDVGGENCDERGFEWGTDQDVPLDNSWTETNSYGTGAFSHGVTGLASGTTYYCRAKAHNSGGWSYGAVRAVTTESPVVHPADTTTRVSSIRHIFQPGLNVMQAGLGDLGFDIDVAEAAIRKIVAGELEKEPEKWICPWDGQVFSSAAALWAHAQVEHLGGYPPGV